MTAISNPDTTARSRVRTRLLTIAAAVVAAAVVFVVADLLLSDPIEVKGAGGATQAVTLVAVILASLVIGLLGWGLLTLLERATRNGRKVWTIIAAVVLVVSLAGPAGGTTGGAVATLVVLHLLVGGILIAGLRR